MYRLLCCFLFVTNNLCNLHFKVTYYNFKRPCLVGINTLVLSDSTMRAFGRNARTFPGYCIVAYGGAEILELSMILRAGQLNRSINLGNRSTRDRILDGRDDVPTLRWCYQCKSECFEQFTGKILVCIGLNNSIQACDYPAVQERNGHLQDTEVNSN